MVLATQSNNISVSDPLLVIIFVLPEFQREVNLFLM